MCFSFRSMTVTLSTALTLGVSAPAALAQATVTQTDTSIPKQTESVDVGVQGGVGVELARLMIEGRYTKGLRDIGKDLTLGQKITTQSFAF